MANFHPLHTFPLTHDGYQPKKKHVLILTMMYFFFYLLDIAYKSKYCEH